MGISPADMYSIQPEAPQQSEANMNPFENRTLPAQAGQFIRNETEKIKQLTQAQLMGQQAKSLTPEDKMEMRTLLANKQTIEYINKMDRLAPLFYILTRGDEVRTAGFIRLVL